MRPRRSQPLPDNPYAAGTTTYEAYATCLTLESAITPVGWLGPPTMVCARLLGYMIIHSPTDDGRTNITNEINSCNADGMALHILAKSYVDHYLRPFKQNQGRTPAPSAHISRPSFVDMQEIFKYLLVEPPESHTEAKQAALRRDGYRCMITGRVDRFTAHKYPNEFAELIATNGVRGTECAHIFAPSTSQGISGDNIDGPKHNYAASAWAVMMRMGGVLVPDELNGPDVHRLENVMTIELELHAMFDTLRFWLEATDEINQYTLHATQPFHLDGYPEIVIFVAHANLPLPDPRYLALHAACAKVAHLSGAGEYVDDVNEDIDTTLVLATDGSSARLLAEALSRIAITA